MRLGPCLGGLMVALAACGDNQPGFDAVLTSEHFRFYVHHGAVAPQNTIELLETHYRESRAFLKFPEVVVDYHLFATMEQGRLACYGSPSLKEPAACAPGSKVFSYQPVHLHELIHAYLASLGSPPPLVQEGVAMGVSCALGSSLPNPQPWRTVATERPTETLNVHSAGLTLFVYLLRRFGIDAFLDYYRYARRTFDPEIFQEDFESFWQIPIDTAWIEMQRSRNDNGTISPICPCTQARTLGVDGNPTDLGIYSVAMPLPDSDPGPYVFIAKGWINLTNCAQDYLNIQLAGAPAKTSRITVAQLLPERHYISYDTQDSISATKGNFMANTCGAAQPVRIPPGYVGDVAMLATAGPTSTMGDWYARFTLDQPRTLRIQPPNVSANRLTICPTCDAAPEACTSIPWDGGEITLEATGPEVVMHATFSLPHDSFSAATFALLPPPAASQNPE